MRLIFPPDLGSDESESTLLILEKHNYDGRPGSGFCLTNGPIALVHTRTKSPAKSRPSTPAFFSITAPCGPKSVGTHPPHPISSFQENYRFGFLATPTPSQSQFLTIPLVKNGFKNGKNS